MSRIKHLRSAADTADTGECICGADCRLAVLTADRGVAQTGGDVLVGKEYKSSILGIKHGNNPFLKYHIDVRIASMKSQQNLLAKKYTNKKHQCSHLNRCLNGRILTTARPLHCSIRRPIIKCAVRFVVQ